MRSLCRAGNFVRTIFVTSALSYLVACGGGSGNRTPTQPSTPTPPAVPSNQWMLKGWVAETLTGTPIDGAKLVFSLVAGTREVVTQADGAWEISQASSESLIQVEASATGYVTRRTYLLWNIGTRGDIVIDLIKDSPPFSMSYYRELVRNQFDEPEKLQPIRRWTKAPNFYIHKHNPRTDEDIPPNEFELLVSSIRIAVPQMTGGRFEAGAIDHGSEARPEQAGYITVKFVYEPDAEYCGRARVASDPGEITLNHGVDGCSSPCGPFAPRTVAHEIGHALGFWHVAEGTVLNTVWFDRTCGVTAFSEGERHHARVAYARPPGNLDTDSDPAAAALFQPPAGPPVVISCK